MRRSALILSALAVVVPATARAQTIAQQVSRARDGTIRMSFATRANVCGDGQFIGIDLADAFWSYTVWDDGFMVSRLEDVRPDCTAGPLRLVVVKEDGQVTDLRAAVGVAWRPSDSATDFGMVSAPEAASWLVGLGETGSDRVARMAFLSAAVADSTAVSARIIEIARNQRLSAGVRERAMRWVADIAAAEGRPQAADEALRGIAGDATDLESVRERAVRELQRSPSNRAFLRSLYGRADRTALRERIVRVIAAGATDDDAAWIRDVALNTSESVEVRERAVRVLGEELGRTGDVRDLYAKLDRTSLRERALRVVAAHDAPGVAAWLRQVAEDTSEDGSLRERAIRLLGERGELEYLQQLYPRLDRAPLRERVVRLVAEHGGPEAATWLTGIVLDRNERSDLRERAVRELAASGTSSTDLAGVYDRVDDRVVKRRLVRLLAERGDDAAVRKLSAIADGDPDPAMRREAGRRLEQKRSP